MFPYSRVPKVLGLAIRRTFLQAIVSRAIGWALPPPKRQARPWAIVNDFLEMVKLRPVVRVYSYLLRLILRQ